ncbi:MAG: Unknown protein [uncultured Sulfurovum sp.]|uniref:Uncharacterized protein n=1 Tax=uncultured Sulfurovum sp. TaxID=269237 RepID=A0A6S6SD60_9BACT|nr:MAG: Unknown protein [uncultured Sulfurovum sp.]
MKKGMDALKVKYKLGALILDTEDNELIIIFDNDCGGIEKMRYFKLVKNVSLTWIENKIISVINEVSAYKNLTKVFQKAIKDVDVDTYATTYGIGIHTVLMSEEELRNKSKAIFNLLDNKGIKYKLQYSRAMWVLKIVISKSKENLKKINTLKI